MERKHGYSLSSFFDFKTEDGEEKLFDLCENFMEHSEGRIENDDWKILGEQCAQINIVNKHSLENYTVHVDIDREMEDAWKEIAEEEERYYENVNRVNDRIKKSIESLHGKEFLKELCDFAEESEVLGIWEIVNKTTGSYQEEDLPLIKGVWVDQWCNGGFVGDDFQGYIYVELKKDKYLKMQYAC